MNAQPIGEIALKGFHRPLAVYAVTGLADDPAQTRPAEGAAASP